MTRLNLAAALLALGGLAALPACSSPSYTQTSSAYPAPAAQELSPGMVRQVQTSLQQQGLYNGAIDGIWGPQTQAAVQSFQQAHSLNASGRLNSATLAALNLPADNTTAPAQQSSMAPPPADTANSTTAPNTTMPSNAPTTTTSSVNGPTTTQTP
jgi:peptidoglycan hydrolase-like protein with peptidoglycan-binding domain